jgi:hypothetical protein
MIDARKDPAVHVSLSSDLIVKQQNQPIGQPITQECATESSGSTTAIPPRNPAEQQSYSQSLKRGKQSLTRLILTRTKDNPSMSRETKSAPAANQQRRFQ